MNGTGFNNFSDTANFFVVYPTGLFDNFLGGNSWNNAMNPFNTTDDVGFVEDMIDTISESYSVDSTRIYATGFSMGAFFSHYLACNLNERFAAIASVSGMLASSVLTSCSPAQAISVLHFHGTADQTIAYDGSTSITSSSVNASIEHWANFNSCNTNSDTTNLPDIANDGYTVQKVEWQDCTDSTEVVLFIEHNAPHTWLQSYNDIYATAEIWRFFRRHRKHEVQDTSTTGLQLMPKDIEVSPNPFLNNLAIKVQGTNSLNSVMIFDIYGRPVFHESYRSTGHIEIDTENWHEGVYLLWLHSHRSVHVQKLLKPHSY